MLCKPVVVADYPTAASQIRSGEDGVIVPLENAACAEGIVRVIRDTRLQSNLIQFLKAHDYGNESEVEKFTNLYESDQGTKLSVGFDSGGCLPDGGDDALPFAFLLSVLGGYLLSWIPGAVYLIGYEQKNDRVFLLLENLE